MCVSGGRWCGWVEIHRRLIAVIDGRRQLLVASLTELAYICCMLHMMHALLGLMRSPHCSCSC